MSLSITKLMNAMNELVDNTDNEEGTLYNPDIPTGVKDFNPNQVIRDQYFNSMKMPTQPRNGNGFSLPRTTFSDDPRRDDFLKNGSINPETIRSQSDPDYVPTNLYSQHQFSLTKNELIETDNVNLVNQAHKSYLNYKNRFVLQEEQKQ